MYRPQNQEEERRHAAPVDLAINVPLCDSSFRLAMYTACDRCLSSIARVGCFFKMSRHRTDDLLLFASVSSMMMFLVAMRHIEFFFESITKFAVGLMVSTSVFFKTNCERHHMT